MSEYLKNEYDYKKIKIDKNVRSRDLNHLHPTVKQKMEQFIFISNNYLKQFNLEIFPIFTFRTAEQQNEAFKNGFSKARAGNSNHEFGLACDFGVRRINKSNKNDGYLDASTLKSDQELAVKTYKDISRFAKDLGIEWGGDWKSFKDNPHFQYTKNKKGYNDKQLREALKNGENINDLII